MKIQILDHGYVEFIEAWGQGSHSKPTATEAELLTGNDYEVGIIEAARQSTQGNFRGWEQDERLLSYLYTSDPPHATPFEFAGMVIEVQAPLFVFREWHRHRTQSYNEQSARYASLPDFQYLPTIDRVMMVNIQTKNKQAGNVGGIALSNENATKWLEMAEQAYHISMEAYRYGLAVGVAKEVARLTMPVAQFSRMRASANLRNWLGFLRLRTDSKAQWEIQQYANAVKSLIDIHFPQTAKYFAWEQDK
jgi:thymidylate synthase (FAD)